MHPGNLIKLGTLPIQNLLSLYIKPQQHENMFIQGKIQGCGLLMSPVTGSSRYIL